MHTTSTNRVYQTQWAHCEIDSWYNSVCSSVLSFLCLAFFPKTILCPSLYFPLTPWLNLFSQMHIHKHKHTHKPIHIHSKNYGVKITPPVLIEDYTMHFTPVLNLRCSSVLILTPLVAILNTIWCYVQTLGCNFNTRGCGLLLTLTGVILTPQFLQCTHTHLHIHTNDKLAVTKLIQTKNNTLRTKISIW